MKIEKFNGEFRKEDAGCTIVINSTIQSIKDIQLVGLYVFLSTLPPNWKINPKHLMNHFQCGRDKIYKLLNGLMRLGLLSCKEVREQGRFKANIYTLHVKPLKNKEEDFGPPCPENPYTEKSDTGNQDTYIKKKEENKERDKIILSSEEDKRKKKVAYAKKSKIPKASEYRKDDRFMKFYNAYPVHKKAGHAYKMWLKLNPDDALLERMLEDIEKRMTHDSSWIDGYIPHPATYLNPECPVFEDEIFNRDKIKAQNKKKSIEAIKAEQEKKQAELDRLSKQRYKREERRRIEQRQDSEALKRIVDKVKPKGEFKKRIGWR